MAQFFQLGLHSEKTAMNASTITSISQFTLIQTYITRYFMIPVYVFGIMGNIANIILFCQHRIRMNNACVRYFIALSIGNIVLITIGGFSRSLPFLNGFNPEATSLIFCKLRLYIIHFSLLYMRTLVSLISIDRWMVTASNASIRQWSTPKIAAYIIILVIVVTAIFGIHAPIGFEIRFNRCYAYLNTAYVIFFSIYNLVTAILPVVIMVIFSSLTIRNIRQSHQRIQPISFEIGTHPPTNAKAPHGSNGQFLRLALIQSLSFIILNIGYAVVVIYDAATSSIAKSDSQRLLDAFIYGLSSHPVYIFCSITFLTYTLASVSFRRECINTLRHFSRNIIRWFHQ